MAKAKSGKKSAPVAKPTAKEVAGKQIAKSAKAPTKKPASGVARTGAVNKLKAAVTKVLSRPNSKLSAKPAVAPKKANAKRAVDANSLAAGKSEALATAVEKRTKTAASAARAIGGRGAGKSEGSEARTSKKKSAATAEPAVAAKKAAKDRSTAPARKSTPATRKASAPTAQVDSADKSETAAKPKTSAKGKLPAKAAQAEKAKASVQTGKVSAPSSPSAGRKTGSKRSSVAGTAANKVVNRATEAVGQVKKSLPSFAKRAVAVAQWSGAAVAVQNRRPDIGAKVMKTKGKIEVPKSGELLSEEQVRRAPEEAYMNEHQLAFFQARLTQMRSEVLAREIGVKERLHQREIFADPADRASAEEEHWLDLRLRERESLLLKKVDEALRRIRDREYGYCDKTGEPIGIARLLARPTATVCVDVKGQNERAESQYRDR